MAKPGPNKGEGGRPRTKNPKPRKDGYKRTTVGPPGKGEQQYEHRVKASGGDTAGGKKAPKGSKSGKKGGVVDHKDRNRSNNAKSNLRKTTKRGNNQNKGK